MATLAASNQHQGIQWGGMIVGAAKVTAAVAVTTVVSYFLYEFIGAVWNDQLSPDFKQSITNAWADVSDVAHNAWESVKQFFSDLGSNVPTQNEAAQFVKDAWSNDWVKGGTIVAALGAGAYGAGKWREQVNKSRATEAKANAPTARTEEDSQAYREIKRRLDTLRANELGR